MKTWLVGVAAIGLVLTACGADKSASSSTPAGNVTPAASPTPTLPDAHVGDTITDTDSDEFTVYSEGPFTPTNDFIKPEAGNIFVAVDVKEKAGPDGLRANPFDFAIVMDDDTRYQPGPGWKDPPLHATELGGGQAVRGWITFEVPAQAKIVRVVLTSSTDIFWDVP